MSPGPWPAPSQFSGRDRRIGNLRRRRVLCASRCPVAPACLARVRFRETTFFAIRALSAVKPRLRYRCVTCRICWYSLSLANPISPSCAKSSTPLAQCQVPLNIDPSDIGSVLQEGHAFGMLRLPERPATSCNRKPVPTPALPFGGTTLRRLRAAMPALLLSRPGFLCDFPHAFYAQVDVTCLIADSVSPVR